MYGVLLTVDPTIYCTGVRNEIGKRETRVQFSGLYEQ